MITPRAGWAGLLALGAALIIGGCTFRPRVPNGTVSCRQQTDCPRGFSCLPAPGGAQGRLCCAGDSCEPGGARPVDAGADARDSGGDLRGDSSDGAADADTGAADGSTSQDAASDQSIPGA